MVDDDPAVRTALGRLIASAGHEVRTFGSAREFLASPFQQGPGCLLLDVRLPDLDGFELYRQLREAGATIPVIFMTGFGDIPTSVKAIKSGAVDFLAKPVAEDTLLSAIDAALAGEAERQAERQQLDEIRHRYSTLTPREVDVLRLVLAGRLNKQIGRELGISEKTVKVHRGRLMTKMGARRVAQLVQLAVHLGLTATAVEPRPVPSEPGLPRRSALEFRPQ